MTCSGWSFNVKLITEPTGVLSHGNFITRSILYADDRVILSIYKSLSLNPYQSYD